MRRVVCPSCDGTGHHLPESLSGDVTEMCAEDEEFEERYMSSGYDVTCTECHGNNVVTEMDRDKLNAAALARLEEIEQANYEYAQERASEARWGC